MASAPSHIFILIRRGIRESHRCQQTLLFSAERVARRGMSPPRRFITTTGRTPGVFGVTRRRVKIVWLHFDAEGLKYRTLVAQRLAT